MIQDLGDVNDEDKLAGCRLCWLEIWFWGMLGGSPWAEDAPPALEAPQDSGGMGARGRATAQQGISGLTATS